MDMNSDEIVYSSNHKYSNNSVQWYCYWKLRLIMTILSPCITFCKSKIIEILIIELYLISNGMKVNNSVINYGVSNNNTLILFRILLIIFIFGNSGYMQAYCIIRQWNQINIDIKWSLLYQRYLVYGMNYVSNRIRVFCKRINELGYNYCLICQYINYNYCSIIYFIFASDGNNKTVQFKAAIITIYKFIS